MRRVALIYNPASGQHSGRRASYIRNALAVLRKAGVEAEALETHAPGSGKALALGAVRQGYDAVLACGGDGTVHEVLQPLVGTKVALGVVPLGTANALAQNLGLGRDPVKAVRALLDAKPMEVRVGRIFFQETNGSKGWRYFTVAAGVGADALLMSSMDPDLKRRYGYALYMLEAFKIWASHSFPLFDASFSTNGNGAPRVEQVSQLLAIRIRSFGGALGMLAPGATLRKKDLSLVAFKTRSRLQYLRFLLATVAGRQTFSRSIELLDADSVECRTLNGSKSRVFVEADGEVLGALPARIELARETLTLLVPPGAQP
ncbi:MAG: diacylglycerol kinase family protein [Terracidiphilus sp.]